jgi:hypothetical protein
LSWPRTETIHALYSSNGFRPITVVRNPFDLLVAVLAAVQVRAGQATVAEHASAYPAWLDEQPETTEMLSGADPTSKAFLAWAKGERAEEILAAASSWVCDPGAIKVFHDELTTDLRAVTEQVLELAQIEAPAELAEPTIASEEVAGGSIAPVELEAWTGSWRDLLTEDVAGELVVVHQKVFRELGLEVPSDLGELPAAAAARAKWRNAGFTVAPGSDT